MSLTIRVHKNDQGKVPWVTDSLNLRVIADDPHDADFRLITAANASDFAAWIDELQRNGTAYSVVK